MLNWLYDNRVAVTRTVWEGYVPESSYWKGVECGPIFGRFRLEVYFLLFFPPMKVKQNLLNDYETSQLLNVLCTEWLVSSIWRRVDCCLSTVLNCDLALQNFFTFSIDCKDPSSRVAHCSISLRCSRWTMSGANAIKFYSGGFCSNLDRPRRLRFCMLFVVFFFFK